jgi:hypothetical protein
VTSVSIDYFTIRVKSMLSRDYPLFIKSKNNDLITFAEEIGLTLDAFSTYIFTDAGYSGMPSLPDRLGKALGHKARVLISFVAPMSG